VSKYEHHQSHFNLRKFILGFFILEKQLANILDRDFLFPVILFYSTLLALTDGQKDGRRVKYTCFAWAGGTFSPVVLLCQFLFWREIGIGFTYLHTLLNSLSAKSILAGEKLVAMYSIST
jgi:hypothetical protein